MAKPNNLSNRSTGIEVAKSVHVVNGKRHMVPVFGSMWIKRGEAARNARLIKEGRKP